MKIEPRTTSFVHEQSRSDVVHGQEIYKRSVEIAEMASKIIWGVGASLSAACIIGIWAFPLDLVIRSASVKVLAIPASLLALPIVFIVCGIAALILNCYQNNASSAYHPVLLAKILMNGDETLEALKEKYREVSENVEKIDLTRIFDTYKGCNLALSHQKLKFILQNSISMRELELNAAFLPENGLSTLSKEAPYHRKTIIHQCDKANDLSMFDKERYQISHLENNVVIVEEIPPKYSESVSCDDTSNSYTYGSWDRDYSSDDRGGNDVSFAFEWR